MKQYNFSKEEMNFMINRLKGVCSKPSIIEEDFLKAKYTSLCDPDANCDLEISCAECIEFKLNAFLDIVKDVFVNNALLVQEKPKEKKLHKYRLFDYDETLDWVEITDEQLRLLEYLQSNDLLGNEIDFEECGIVNFKKI